VDQERLIRTDTLLGLLFLGIGLLLVLIVALALFFTPSVLLPGGQSAGARQPADKAKPALAPAPAAPAPAGATVLLPDPASPDSALNNVSADERLSEIPIRALAVEAASLSGTHPEAPQSSPWKQGNESDNTIPIDRPARQSMRLSIPALVVICPPPSSPLTPPAPTAITL
jgi:hypothetical protein